MITLEKISCHDIYEIVEEEGQKIIHVLGYFYKSDDHCEKSEYTFCEISLKDFLEELNDKDGDYREMLNELEDSVTMYVQDFKTETEALNAFSICYEGEQPKPLSYTKLTMDTPCGGYIDMEE